jgi:hypothetical protein
VLELQKAPEGKGKHGLWLVTCQEWMETDLLSKIEREVLIAFLREEAELEGHSKQWEENMALDAELPGPAELLEEKSVVADDDGWDSLSWLEWGQTEGAGQS